MNWGKGIVIAFIVFAIVIGSLVVISLNQEVGLVAPDYYQQEIAYQDQIERKENFNALKSKPIIKKVAENVLIVDFPKELYTTFVNGNLLLFRPSNAKLDRKLEIVLDSEGQQRIPVSDMIKGMWKIKMSWKAIDDVEYYSESIIHI